MLLWISQHLTNPNSNHHSKAGPSASQCRRNVAKLFPMIDDSTRESSISTSFCRMLMTTGVLETLQLWSGCLDSSLYHPFFSFQRLFSNQSTCGLYQFSCCQHLFVTDHGVPTNQQRPDSRPGTIQLAAPIIRAWRGHMFCVLCWPPLPRSCSVSE